MGKKAKEFKSGDFIFAKVKGYPAWPARVQSFNGKKYFVYFYGTAETANLPGNMIFDYETNKAKFVTKNIKRKDFQEGVRQIEVDFENKTPLEDILGPLPEAPPANDTADESALNNTMDTTAPDSTLNDTVADTSATTQNDSIVEDSDDPGALVIDEGKPAKGRKSTAKTPKEPVVKTPKTPRGRPAKKDQVDASKEMEVEEAKDEEIVSRSGRKIRPKKFVDEQTEENSTLPSPSPAAKKRKLSTDKDKPEESAKKADVGQKQDKTSKSDFNNIPLSELEDLKELFKSADPEKDNILMAHLPSGTYVGIKLFQSCPKSFKNDAVKLQWEKDSATNAITLKTQLECGQITPQSIAAQLVTDLNLTDEEKAALDKEREAEEKKSRVNFLKAEMKLIELDAKIKSCLCLEKADTDLCLKLLDELQELNVRPLMLYKHPTCLETVKRMRAYVGNTPSWDLSESDALLFGKQAHRIRKQADVLYAKLKALFSPPSGLSFWEYFSSRVLQFKQATANLSADELLEMVTEPVEMGQPTAHTMRSAIDVANVEEPLNKEEKADSIPSDDAASKDSESSKKKEKASKKETPKKTPKKDLKKDTIKEDPKKKEVKEDPKKKDAKEDSKKKDSKEDSKKKDSKEDSKKKNSKEDSKKKDTEKEMEKEVEKDKQDPPKEVEEANGNDAPEAETEADDAKKDAVSKKKAAAAAAKAKKASTPTKPAMKRQSSRKQNNDTPEPTPEKPEESLEPTAESDKEPAEPTATPVEPKDVEPSEVAAEPKETEKVITNGDGKPAENKTVEDAEDTAEAEKPEDKKRGKEDKEKEQEDEPRAKRSRSDNKKSEAPPKSPARSRKTKA